MSAWEHDALMVRTAGLDGSSSSGKANGFRWPTSTGEVVEAPDWNPEPVCGGGLHGLLAGLGDWGLMRAPSDTAALWYVCGVRRDECVEIDGKVKVPRAKVLYCGHFGGAMELIAPALSAAVLELVRDRVAKAVPSDGSSATGDLGAASATGDRGAASATGKHGVALACGHGAHGMVGEGCLLVLLERDPDDHHIVHHLAAMAGTQGVEAGKWYTLKGGVLSEVSE